MRVFVLIYWKRCICVDRRKIWLSKQVYSERKREGTCCWRATCSRSLEACFLIASIQNLFDRTFHRRRTLLPVGKLFEYYRKQRKRRDRQRFFKQIALKIISLYMLQTGALVVPSLGTLVGFLYIINYYIIKQQI